MKCLSGFHQLLDTSCEKPEMSENPCLDGTIEIDKDCFRATVDTNKFRHSKKFQKIFQKFFQSDEFSVLNWKIKWRKYIGGQFLTNQRSFSPVTTSGKWGWPIGVSKWLAGQSDQAIAGEVSISRTACRTCITLCLNGPRFFSTSSRICVTETKCQHFCRQKIYFENGHT